MSKTERTRPKSLQALYDSRAERRRVFFRQSLSLVLLSVLCGGLFPLFYLAIDSQIQIEQTIQVARQKEMDAITLKRRVPRPARDLSQVKCMPYLPSPVFEDWELERFSTEECISFRGIKKSAGEAELTLHICTADGVSRTPLEQKKLPVLRLLTSKAYIEAFARRRGDTIQGEVQVERILEDGVSFMMAVEFEEFTLRQLTSVLDSLLEAPVEPHLQAVGSRHFGRRCRQLGLFHEPVGWTIAQLMVPSWH